MSMKAKIHYIGSSDCPQELVSHFEGIFENVQTSGNWKTIIEQGSFIQQDHHRNTFPRLTMGRDLLKGEVGCALAHKRIYQAIADSNSECTWFAVLEEDAVTTPVDPAYRTLLKSYFRENTKHPAVIMLGWNSDGIGLSISRGPLDRLLSIPTGTFAYALNKAAARVLGNSAHVNHVADWPMEAVGVKFYKLKEALFLHDSAVESFVESVSAITRKKADDNRAPVLKRLASLSSIHEFYVFLHFVIIRGLGFATVRLISRKQSKARQMRG